VAIEGMVDALRRAHRIVSPRGCVVDLHPTAERATVSVGTRATGHVDSKNGPLRHTAAAVALERAIEDGLFSLERADEFAFHTYADSAEELRDYVREHWKDSRVGDETVRRTRDAHRHSPRTRPRVTERVRASLLRPLSVR
jgi:hypothetical protein